MSENLPTLYKNIMSGLPSQFACDCFLWASDKFQNDRMGYKAERFAIEADDIVRSVKTLVHMRQMATLREGGKLLDEDQEADLLRFFQKRHANYRMGGNVKSEPPVFVAAYSRQR